MIPPAPLRTSARRGNSPAEVELPGTDPLLALRAGDAAPFEAFVRAWTRKLVAWFHRQGASTNRAEDLAQEVFLRLFQGAHRYRPRERLAAYCFRTARNLWIDECRRAAARVDGAPARAELELAEGVGVRLDPLTALLFEEEESCLREMLGELPLGQRRVFELALLFELTYPEIGAVLSIPVGTVKSRMFHAVRRLRDVWRAKHAREGVA